MSTGRGEDRIYQPARAIVGLCPKCQAVVVILNNYETWPPVECRCGWVGPTTGLDNRARFEEGAFDLPGKVSIG